MAVPKPPNVIVQFFFGRISKPIFSCFYSCLKFDLLAGKKMPKTSKKHKQWDPDRMIRAIRAVRGKEMGYLKASKLFAVPKSTLEDYVKQENKTPEQLVAVKIGRRPVLSAEMEADLVSYCLEMDRRFYGIGTADIKRLAYQIALRNGLRHPFAHAESAGKKWLRGFMRRNAVLSLRKPQGISKARIKGFTPENVSRFYDLLETSMEKVNFNPARVYNVDESGITTVQSKNTRVITLKGKKQVGSVTATERGALVTVVFCMNAAGGFVPPLFVFPRKNMKVELLDGSPPGSIAACHPSGWIQQHIFSQWLQHFVAHVKPSREDPVLLILDGHYSHTRNIDVIEAGRANFVTILCIPPHSSHKLQPLDLSFMSPFKTYYSQQIEMWLRQNPGRTINSYQICKLMCPAYLKSATAEISANGFRKSGIYPFNKNNFSDHDFIMERQRERTPPPINQNHGEVLPTRGQSRPEPQSIIERTPPKHNLTNKSSNGNATETTATMIRAEDISPLPSCSYTSQTNKQKNPRKGSSWMITSTPYKDELERSVAEQERKKSLKEKKPKISNELNQVNRKKTPRQKKQKKKIESSSSDTSHPGDDLILDDDSDMDVDDEDGDTECMFCDSLYSEDTHGEKWIRCIKCFKWCHEMCANADKKKTYICDFCQDV
ncbi:uncharacterized protein [Diabrotica undecimpunctata]|uniref:uncharacterized protein n=1 Tax=Diabrotica undecimpunctata TaxID=50387 RepID=UPI003B6342F2